MATNFGATSTINAANVDAVEAVKEATGGDGVEIAFEAIGNVNAARQAWDMVRAGGTACIVGMMPLGSEVSLPGPEFLQEKKAIGCMYGSTRFREHMPKLLDLYRQGKLDLTGLVTRRFELGEINEAFAAMQNGEVARGVLDISQP